VDTNKQLPATAGAVVNGTRQPSLVPLDIDQQDAVVGLSDADTVPFGAFCSGTLIASDIVLTAQHCTAGYRGDELRVLFGADELDPKLVLESVEIREHPTRDLALVRLARPPENDIDVRPIPAALEPPRADTIGSLVENAGFGDTERLGKSNQEIPDPRERSSPKPP
jgi:hypothetical protein